MSLPVRQTIALIVLLLMAFAVFSMAKAQARDLGQWTGQDAAIGAWFRSVMQPDNPAMSCCGPADAYWADEVETGHDGELIAVVTDDRDDAPLNRPHVPIGTKIVIPPQKIQYRYGNPTGHVVVFLGAAENVYCYVQNGGV